MESQAPLSPSETLSAVLRTLMGAVGVWGGRGWLSGALALVMWGRVSRARVAMERLAARFAAGRLRCAWPRPVARVRAVAEPGAEEMPKVARAGWGLPGRFGWLVKAAAWQAVGYGSQLRTVLETPEMVALLTAAPQAVRILRPVCRALGIETSVLRPGVLRPGVVQPEVADAGVMECGRAAHPPKKRVRKKVDWGRIPLPRGVLSAVRRRGEFGTG